VPETTTTLAGERPPVPAAAPAHKSTLQSMLGLSNTEIEILMRLVAWGRLAREQIYGITVSGHRTLKPSSINPIMVELRKKLIAHRIKLVTIRDFGFGLSQEDRGRIVELIRPRCDTEVAGEKLGWSPKRTRRARRPPEDLLRTFKRRGCDERYREFADRTRLRFGPQARQ
jgi:hypothetical protein